jgi:Cu/Ag efflux pump CusA
MPAKATNEDTVRTKPKREWSKIFVSSEETERKLAELLARFPGLEGNRSYAIRRGIELLHGYLVEDKIPGSKPTDKAT